MIERQVFELSLPYWKQGDDVGSAVELMKDLHPDKNPNSEALLFMADKFEAMCRDLRRLAVVFEKTETVIDHADVHHISIIGPSDLADVIGNELEVCGLIFPEWLEDISRVARRRRA